MIKTGKPKLKVFAIIAKFSDGKVRQILMDKEAKSLILNILALKTGAIMVLENPIEGIDISKGEPVTTE